MIGVASSRRWQMPRANAVPVEPTLRELDKALDAARHTLHEAIAERFYAGRWVRATFGHNEVSVRVIEVRYDNVFVRNPISGKEYWIHAYRLVEFYHD